MESRYTAGSVLAGNFAAISTSLDLGAKSGYPLAKGKLRGQGPDAQSRGYASKSWRAEGPEFPGEEGGFPPVPGRTAEPRVACQGFVSFAVSAGFGRAGFDMFRHPRRLCRHQHRPGA